MRLWGAVGGAVVLAIGCVSAEEAQVPDGDGGTTSSTGGEAPVGGTSGTGGFTASGGVTTGGGPVGGTQLGGSATGGAALGGSGVGGTATGGTGGAATGGNPTGGAVTGGAPTGGAATGGTLILLSGGTGGTGTGTVPIDSNSSAECETVSLACDVGWPFSCDTDPAGGCTDEGGYFCCEPGCAPAASRADECTSTAFPNPYLCHSSQIAKLDGCETVGSLVCCP